MLSLLSRALSSLTGHPILPRWIQDITGLASTSESAEEGGGVYHAMGADGTSAAAMRQRANTGIVVTVGGEVPSGMNMTTVHAPAAAAAAAQTIPLQ